MDNQHIAVIGLGCRLPGGIDSPADFWRALVEGRDAVAPPSPERIELCGWRNHAPSEGGFLRDVAGFDAEFFGVSGREAAVLDPQHRLLLEVGWEALEHAGIPPTRAKGSATGVFTGLSYGDYMEQLAGGPSELEGSILTNGHCVAPGRISYLLGLHGPSMALDTACSSSLVALHLACQSLLAGECDLALAGGVTLILQPRITRSFARMGMLSASGRCRTFDASADGFVRGEGCGMVVLKRLRDAQRDGDRVLALVRGSAVNQDGPSEGLAAPSVTAQRAVYEAALTSADVDPGDVGLIETHGTGTRVGDPTEFAGLAQVYDPGQDSCALTSVKTNLGHLEPAAGIVGFIKTVLCLRNEVVPPNLHFARWSPSIDAAHTRFFVPTARPVPWPVLTGARLAAVSSFGFSGTNAHAVLERASERVASVPRARWPEPASSVEPSSEPEVFLVPAGSADALPEAARRLADWVSGDGAGTPLRDIAHTLALRRDSGRGRLGVVAGSHDELAKVLRRFAEGQAQPRVVRGVVTAGVARRPVFVFSGQGSQWAGMGRELLAVEPAFRTALAEIDPLISAETGFSVLEIIRRAHPVRGCGRVQPLLFAIQLALAATWRAHGVEPAAVIGHSMGEVAAAVVSGALSPTDGARVICRRSLLLDRIAGRGSMATVALDAAAVAKELKTREHEFEDQVSIAVLAAPGSTVVAGSPDDVRRLVDGWRACGLSASLVAVDVASHSPQVDPLLPDLRDILGDLTPCRPAVPFYSTVLDDPRDTPPFDADYWCDNLRRPVRFAAALAAAAADQHTVYAEVSPHPVVSQAMRQNLIQLVADPVVLPTLRREEEERATFRTQLAALHCAGGSVDWSVPYGDGTLADAPTIAFDRAHHWTEPAAATTSSGPGPLPGNRAEIPGTPARQSWTADVGTAELPWLAEHLVNDEPILPGAVHHALALSCACQLLAAEPYEIEIRDLRFLAPLRLAEHTIVTTLLTPGDADRVECVECEILGRADAQLADSNWVRQATASLRRLGGAPRVEWASLETLALRHPRRLAPEELYQCLRSRRLVHGPAFQGISELFASRRGESFLARVELPAAARLGDHSLRVHPVLLDLCAQLAVAPLIGQRDSHPLLPAAIESVRMPGDPSTATHCHARVVENTGASLVAHVRLLDAAGRPLLIVQGLRFARHTPEAEVPVDDAFLQIGWEEVPLPPADRTSEPAAAGPVVIAGDSIDAAAPLAVTLGDSGVETQVWEAPGTDMPLEDLTERLIGKLAGDPPPRAVVLLGNGSGHDGDPAASAVRGVRWLLAATQALVAVAPTPVPRLYAVTRGGDADPAQSALRGVVRVLALEHPELRPTLLDAAPTEEAMAEVAAELLADRPDDEVAVGSGRRRVARLDYAPLTDAERAATARTVRCGEDGFGLRVGRQGDLGTLELVTRDRRAPGPGEVELRVTAAGLNFRDVLTALRMLPEPADRIGFECSGVVTALGDDVRELAVGDRVMGVELNGGCFGSFVTLPAELVVPVPSGMSMVAAAGSLVAYLTAWYALRRVGGLVPGERVLIHSATGGTGLAAVAVARLLGAEVLATAGTEAKRQRLRAMRIGYVGDSRSLDFREEVIRATDGQGVDLVLNSLSGPAIRAGLDTLRPFGRFVELGVRDIDADAPLGLAPLRHNVTFRAVDLIGLRRERPEEFVGQLREVCAELAAGRLEPLPYTDVPLSSAEEAFRTLAGAHHQGKLVLTVEQEGTVTARPAGGPRCVREGGTYVVTGGLGGLGLATAGWLAENGAGHLVLNGRTAPSGTAVEAVRALSARGAKVSVVLGDIAEPGMAERLVAVAREDDRPLCGVVHAAMVLADSAVTEVRDNGLARVWAPKVIGAWRLHAATEGLGIDWFVAYSSLASLIGNPGQVSYAAANAWLDGFAAWRTARGLPTLAVNWGPWGETGVATGFAGRGYETISTEVGLRSLAALLSHGRVRTGVIPGAPLSWIPTAGRRAPFFSRLLPTADGEAPGERWEGGDVRSRLESASPGLERRTVLVDCLAGHIRSVLRLGSASIDPETPLRSLGFDSLLAMEVRVRLESDLGVRLPGNFVWQHPTLAALAAGTARKMGLALD
ncbi:SDR family NAD(P)-dependent oxidoreductase [Streptomyces sp. 8K308]|uniref:type I polyketide synthase n=1 Tax=Streptomyces sp. 8K308 TaxID=2530388 RepID=UPI00104478FB|nr:type I polyketide synthase [Streptomyces sp. 8K308]TDC24916.1 SDR family NAD(P)-dependent oxidoreductase [Streptomyces sp. 8K308]